MLWMAARKGRPERLRDFPQDLQFAVHVGPGEPLETVLRWLRDHLGMAGDQGAFPADNPRQVKWGIRDNPALFQLGVFPELFRTGAAISLEDDGGVPDMVRALDRLRTLEGLALERFAAGWFREQAGTETAASGVWWPGLADAALYVVEKEGEARTLTLGGCKRHATRHDCATLERQFQAFLHDIRDTSKAHIAELPRRRLLISPAFPEYRGTRSLRRDHFCLCEKLNSAHHGETHLPLS